LLILPGSQAATEALCIESFNGTHVMLLMARIDQVKLIVEPAPDDVDPGAIDITAMTTSSLYGLY